MENLVAKEEDAFTSIPAVDNSNMLISERSVSSSRRALKDPNRSKVTDESISPGEERPYSEDLEQSVQRKRKKPKQRHRNQLSREDT